MVKKHTLSNIISCFGVRKLNYRSNLIQPLIKLDLSHVVGLFVCVSLLE